MKNLVMHRLVFINSSFLKFLLTFFLVSITIMAVHLKIIVGTSLRSIEFVYMCCDIECYNCVYILSSGVLKALVLLPMLCCLMLPNL